MRVIFLSLCGVAFAWAACPAQADVLSYCEAYARSQAEMHLSGSAVLGSKPKLTPAEREKRKMLALADCLRLYTPRSNIETAKTTRDEPETITTIIMPRAKPKIHVQAGQETPARPAAKIEAATTVTPAQKKKPVADAASLVAGSKDYCASKYASYNPATGTYTKHSGEQLRCRASIVQAPTRVTKTPLPVPAAKSKLPTRAVKNQPLPGAAKEKSVWDSFDNPRLPISR